MSQNARHQAPSWKLIIGALGVVYGDIGTSPLYAINESLNPAHGITLNETSVFGVISLVFWAITLVVSLKYVTFVLKADQQGEGGVTALLSLLLPTFKNLTKTKGKALAITLATIGAGLLYGDGIITPAISVLSALEGLQVATTALKPWIVPITVFILLMIFSFQHKGTDKIGKIFGPTIMVWFFTLFMIGLPWVLKRPDIFRAINPIYIVQFFQANGQAAFISLSSIVLCVTGVEALYADMGHFGRSTIRRSWLWIVYPCLLVNYFGQGALVLERGALQNTFYSLVPEWGIYPLICIATFATIVASQAMISGAFSLTQHIVQLGLLPRTTIQHTSSSTEGQIYVPSVNWLLMLGSISLVLVFQSSTNLAGAYGLAVIGTMSLTSTLYFWVTRRIWGWNLLFALPMLTLFLTIDLSFLSANLTKITHGGWIPLVIAAGIFIIIDTWRKGRTKLAKKMSEMSIPLQDFIDQINKDKSPRVRGTAVFMSLSQDIAPSVLIHHYKHNKVLHERVILLSILTEHKPVVQPIEQIRRTDLDSGFYKIVARYGYMETPHVISLLKRCQADGLEIDFDEISYYLGREIFVTSPHGQGMPYWQKTLFIALSRNARSAVEFFKLPPDRVIEIGSQIEV